MCPYYEEKWKHCNFNDKAQSDKDRENYCLSNNWRDCYDYKRTDFETRVAKKLRPNPYL